VLDYPNFKAYKLLKRLENVSKSATNGTLDKLYSKGMIISDQNGENELFLKLEDIWVGNRRITLRNGGGTDQVSADTINGLKERDVKFKKQINLKENQSILISDPFTITSADDFIYTEKLAFSSEETMAKLFAKRGIVTITLSLVDNETDKQITTLRRWKFHPASNHSSKQEQYKIKRVVRGNYQVRLQLDVESKTENEVQYYVLNDYSHDNGSTKIQESHTFQNQVVDEFSVMNYPNPFNPETTIQFSVPESDHVKIEVFDVLGKKVRTLLDNLMHAGTHNIKFNDSGDLASGIYIYRIQYGTQITSGKMHLIK
jgi:hypothetical protein